MSLLFQYLTIYSYYNVGVHYDVFRPYIVLKGLSISHHVKTFLIHFDSLDGQ